MVRTLYGDSLASSNKENRNERRTDECLSLRQRVPLRCAQQQRRVPVQSLHLQALLLLTRTQLVRGALVIFRRGRTFKGSILRHG